MSPFSKVEMSPQRLGGGGDGLGGAVGDEHQGADSPGSGAGGSGSAYGPARGGQAVGSLGAPGETAGQALSSRRQRRARQPPPGASLQPSHRADREGSLHGTGSPALLGFRPDPRGGVSGASARLSLLNRDLARLDDRGRDLAGQVRAAAPSPPAP